MNMILQCVKTTVGRTKTFLLAAVLACLAQSLAAQTTTERITLSKQKITIEELFREIERQTGKTFMVRVNAVNNSKVIEMPSRVGTLEEFITRALIGTGQRWELSGDYIVIGTQPEEPKPLMASKPIRKLIIDKQNLKQLTSGSAYKGDSIVHRAIDAGPFYFNSENQAFYAPGTLMPNKIVVAPLTTAARWQRSKFALKINALYGAVALAPNLRAEFGLGNRTTLELGASYNGWNLDGTIDNNKKLVHGLALAEFRYWFCERFSGHYLGLHALGGFYNVGEYDIPLLFEKEYRYEGTAYGAGLSYGYALPLSPRWGLEFNIGAGVVQMKYDKYRCEKCTEKEGSYNKTYLGPTRAGINLIYIIK